MNNQIGPFIVNNGDALKEIVMKLSEFKFQESFYWNYDPHGILSNIRIKCKLTPFMHNSKPEIEKFLKSNGMGRKYIDLSYYQYREGDTDR